MTIKGVIDIEELLVWAYRDQKVGKLADIEQRAASEPARAWGATWGTFHQLETLGIIVRSSPAAVVAMGARMPADAEIIHDAVLKLADMYVIFVAADEVRVLDGPEAAAEGIAFHKTARGLVARCGDDEWPAHQAVTAALLIVHAASATRPETAPEWSPGDRPRRIDRMGRNVVDHDAAPLDEGEVMLMRSVYQVWRAGLALLAAQLTHLSQFDVTGPIAPANPWPKTTGRVLEGGDIDDALNRKLLAGKRKARFDRMASCG